MRVLVAALLALATPLAADQRLGVIEFPNSGSAEAQAHFLTGVLLMHNFEYNDAAAAFRRAQEADPTFGMAYWGEAMSHYRPVWGREDLEKGRAALAGAAKAKDLTERERRYIEAARIVFGEGEKADRWQRYSDAMGQLHRAHPEDQEAASFYAVSMFGTTGGKRDTRTYMRIAAVAKDVYLENPDHPGALHYLIHSFDDPVHAPLGLRYAKSYAKVASAAPHAQHMPTHIFLALGMWDECVSSNIDSWESSEARVKRLGLGSDSRGYHALWWMQYGYLQLGRFDEARRRLAVIEHDAKVSGSRLARAHHAYMRAQYLIDTEQWDLDLMQVDAEGIEARAWGSNALAEGMRAVKAGDYAVAERWVARVKEYAKQHTDRSDSLPVVLRELEGLILLDKKPKAALAVLRQAAAMEEKTAYGYGPPFPAKPAFELLGDALLAMERPAEAAEAYRTSLDRAPRRALSLKGLRAAAMALGDEATVARMDAEIEGFGEVDPSPGS